MSKSSKRGHRPERLSAAAIAHLDAGLQEIKNTPAHAHARRVDRLAITYRPCKRGTDRLPEGRIEFDAFRLMSLSHRWCDRSGVVTKMVVLGAYRPVVDLPGSGRITFVCEGALTVGRLGGRLVPDPRVNLSGCRTAVLLSQAVADADPCDLDRGFLLPEFFYGFDHYTPPVFEGPRPVEDWLKAEVAIGNLRAWPASFFARSDEASWAHNPVDGSTSPFEGESGAIEEGTIRGSWIVRDGIATPLAQEPRAIFADLSQLGGRSVRNPAWAVLQDHHVIKPRLGYRQWLERIAPYSGFGRDCPDAEDPTTEAGRFRARLAECVDAGGIDALMADVRTACQAAGVPVPTDPEEAYDFLGGLLEDPWMRPQVEDQAAIQRVKLIGLPDPVKMTFGSEFVKVDLYDLGIYNDQYAQVPAGRVAEALDQGRKGHKGARPWRKAMI